MTPTRRRAGAVEAGASPAARTGLRAAGIGAPLVPVPVGYLTSVAVHVVVRRRGGAGFARLRAVVRVPLGVVTLPSAVSRRLIADGECESTLRPPQRLGGVAWLTQMTRCPDLGVSVPVLP